MLGGGAAADLAAFLNDLDPMLRFDILTVSVATRSVNSSFRGDLTGKTWTTLLRLRRLLDSESAIFGVAPSSEIKERDSAVGTLLDIETAMRRSGGRRRDDAIMPTCIYRHSSSQDNDELLLVVGTKPSDLNCELSSDTRDFFRIAAPVIASAVEKLNKQPAELLAKETPLTTRERKILQLIAQGYANREIAQLLDISPWTVKAHVANVLKKTSSATRAEAIAYAIREKFL